jgi:hypothetical protein
MAGGSGGRKHTRAQVALRRDSVEAVVRTGTFSRKKARELGEEWGVTPRQIWRDRDAVIADWAKGLSSADREFRAARLLEETRALRAATATRGLQKGDGSLVRCAVELLKLERDLLGLATPAEVVVKLGAEDPAGLARDLADVLPFIAGMLGDEGQGIIEAAFTEAPALPAPTGAHDE